MERKRIEDILLKLEDINENITGNYNDFEIALLVFLRSDYSTFKDCINDSQIEELRELVRRCDSLLDIDKEDVDYIIYEELEEEE